MVYPSAEAARPPPDAAAAAAARRAGLAHAAGAALQAAGPAAELGHLRRRFPPPKSSTGLDFFRGPPQRGVFLFVSLYFFATKLRTEIIRT